MNGWKTYKLGNIIVTNIKSIGKNYPYTTIQYLDTGSITCNQISEIQTICIDNAPSRAKRIVKKDDIVYSLVRPNQKHYGYIKYAPANLVVSTGFVTITCNTDIIYPKYLYYFLTCSHITNYLQAIAETAMSTYPAIKPSDIEEIEISLPPLEEQKQIAGILSALDDKIELNRRINENLEQQAQALFKHWFVDTLESNATYSLGHLTDIAQYLNGLAMQKYRPQANEQGIPVLKIKELGQGQCDTASDLCSPSISSEYIVSDGDVIFSWSGTLLVDVWCGGICGLNQHLFKVISKNYPKWFIYYWTKHHLDNFVRIAKDKAVTMGHIKRGDLEAAEVRIPDAITLSRLDSIIAPVFNSIISNRVENKRLAELRDTLLPKLMNGEISFNNII